MEKVVCPVCKQVFEEPPHICSDCGFPFNASEKDRAVFIGQQVLKKSKISSTKDRIKTVRIMLWGLGQIHLLQALAYKIKGMHDPFLYTFLLIAGIFLIGSGFLSYKQPLLSILLPLIIISIFHLICLWVDVSLLSNGLIIKLVVHAFLVIGLISIIKAEKIKKESLYLSKLKYTAKIEL